MSTLALNEQNDIYFTNNRLTFISGSETDEEIAQRIKMRLKFFKDEWFLNSEHGTPYYQDILGVKPLDNSTLEFIFKKEILSVKGVKQFIESEIDFDENTREVIYSFKVISTNNTTLIDNLIVI